MNTMTMKAVSNGFAPLAAKNRCQGLTLIEIMVSVLVLSIGLLGLAAMQTSSMKFSTSAFHRTQATALAYDLADRMRGNRLAALNDNYIVAVEAAPVCGAFVGTGNLKDQDIAAWRNAMACRLPQGTGSVVRTNDQFTITIQWDDSQGAEPPLEYVFMTAL